METTSERWELAEKSTLVCARRLLKELPSIPFGDLRSKTCSFVNKISHIRNISDSNITDVSSAGKLSSKTYGFCHCQQAKNSDDASDAGVRGAIQATQQDGIAFQTQTLELLCLVLSDQPAPVGEA